MNQARSGNYTVMFIKSNTGFKYKPVRTKGS